jgi:hypothetical protein
VYKYMCRLLNSVFPPPFCRVPCSLSFSFALLSTTVIGKVLTLRFSSYTTLLSPRFVTRLRSSTQSSLFPITAI